jgi:hypothetical protein
MQLRLQVVYPPAQILKAIYQLMLKGRWYFGTILHPEHFYG